MAPITLEKRWQQINKYMYVLETHLLKLMLTQYSYVNWRVLFEYTQEILIWKSCHILSHSLNKAVMSAMKWQYKEEKPFGKSMVIHDIASCS